MSLFSYCLRYDDGAAPNPFWDVCTLAICKPAIRRTARVGDWVVGLGSTHSPIGNIGDCVVYAMRITESMTLAAYDQFCRENLPHKIPNTKSNRFKYIVGDCIYDYSLGDEPRLRNSVHQERNRKRDLSGRNVLLSQHFYYFGNRPIALPESLKPIIHAQQGHKSRLNEPYRAAFVEWIDGQGLTPNKLHGEPQLKQWIMDNPDFGSHCSRRDREDDDLDQEAVC